MRQVSWIGTALLVGAAIALWVPFPALASLSALNSTATVEPTLLAFYLINELVLSNPSLKLITSLFLLWAALGLLYKTATYAK